MVHFAFASLCIYSAVQKLKTFYYSTPVSLFSPSGILIACIFMQLWLCLNLSNFFSLPWALSDNLYSTYLLLVFYCIQADYDPLLHCPYHKLLFLSSNFSIRLFLTIFPFLLRTLNSLRFFLFFGKSYSSFTQAFSTNIQVTHWSASLICAFSWLWTTLSFL